MCNEIVPAPQGQLAAPGVDFLKARFPDVGSVSFAYPVVPLKGIRLIRKQALTAQPATKRALAWLPLIAVNLSHGRDARRWPCANDAGGLATTIGARRQMLLRGPIRIALQSREFRNLAVAWMRRALAAAARRQNRVIHAEYLRAGRGPEPGVVEGVLSRYKARGSGE